MHEYSFLFVCLFNKAGTYQQSFCFGRRSTSHAIEREMEQYKGEYTDEEIKEIGRLKGILLAQYTKYSVKNIKNGVENAMKEAEGLIDGFLNSFPNESSQ